MLFHLAGSCVAVLPDARYGLDRRAWADARVERELAVWADRVGMTPSAFQDRLYELAVRYEGARSAALAPFEAYFRVSGVSQNWSMFAAGTVESDRFGLRARRCEDCPWEWLYVHADDDHAWSRAVLGHPRVRSAIFRWSWPSHAGRYERGCRALAERVASADADVVAVECSFERSTLPSPSRPDVPAPAWGRARVVQTRTVAR